MAQLGHPIHALGRQLWGKIGRGNLWPARQFLTRCESDHRDGPHDYCGSFVECMNRLSATMRSAGTALANRFSCSEVIVAARPSGRICAKSETCMPVTYNQRGWLEVVRPPLACQSA